MYSEAVREHARRLHRQGVSTLAISRELGVSRAAIREWMSGAPRRPASTCFVCADEPCPAPQEYCYLLGQYLGDGYVVTTIRVPRLRIACADEYPQIAAAVDTAMHRVSGRKVSSAQAIGCSDRGAYWKHWPCLFPQHGPGRKHERPIVLAAWQERLVAAHPWPFLRGLIHSDGCRSMNRVVVRGRAYAYPRYFLANESADILAIAGRILDQVGVDWRYNRPNSISIARRESVALLDAHIGPKR
jgi:hypothetical protein